MSVIFLGIRGTPQPCGRESSGPRIDIYVTDSNRHHLRAGFWCNTQKGKLAWSPEDLERGVRKWGYSSNLEMLPRYSPTAYGSLADRCPDFLAHLGPCQDRLHVELAAAQLISEVLFQASIIPFASNFCHLERCTPDVQIEALSALFLCLKPKLWHQKWRIPE
jgi:hypothetical protein